MADAIEAMIEDFQAGVKRIQEQNEMIEKLAPNDAVNHPSHYVTGGIECIDAIKASMSTIEYQGYCKGNALKYLWRWRLKGGVEDLRKASVYLNWLIKTIDGAEQ